jgi:hypothetical protein
LPNKGAALPPIRSFVVRVRAHAGDFARSATVCMLLASAALA